MRCIVRTITLTAEKRAGIQNMLVHCLTGTLDISLPDGSVDALVIHQRALKRYTIREL